MSIDQIETSFDCTNLLFLEQDLICNDEELNSLFLKEKEINNIAKTSFFNSCERKKAVEWILKTKARYGFSALTAILAVNYLDRFLSSTAEKDKQQQPWMIQLASVTCLSLAAKFEETHAPLLLDLQVGVTDYVFEAKTIQRMELLVLSSLKWRMNLVTPLSFIDHIMRRFGFESQFRNNCENLLLSLLSNSRFAHYLPSVLATSTMLHVIYQLHSSNAIDYENQLLTLLKINKEEVDDCYEFITENGSFPNHNDGKRKLSAMFASCDISNDSWSIIDPSSPHQTIYKKSKVKDQRMRLR